MEQLESEGGLTAARQRLTEIWADPQIRAIARRRANSPQAAEDALQITYLAMFQLRHLGQIENLRGYFCKVLIRAVYHEQAQLSALLVDDFSWVTEQADAAFQRNLLAGLEDTACAAVQAQSWHMRLIRNRDKLAAAVPGRSSDPARYRRVIYAAAEQILRAEIYGEPSEADSNDAFRASYPEYFEALGAVKNTSHQRLSRARLDVRELLQAVVD